jgi:ABC-type Zn2+ transport system substrate-binding protein/surface adhesin
MEGKTLSSTGTVENNPQPDEAQAPHIGPDHDHAHDHEGHDHEGHDHQHGPVLNPDCTRELVLDISAEEVSAAYRTAIIKNTPKSPVSAPARCRNRSSGAAMPTEFAKT